MRGRGIVLAGRVVRRRIDVAIAVAVVSALVMVVPVAFVPMDAAGARLMRAARMDKVQRSQATAARGDERRRAEDEDGMHESAHRPTV